MTEEKKGFKKTEVGLIPEDWDVYELGELGNFKNGINKGKEAFGHGSPFVNLMDVFGIRSISDVKHLNLVDSNTSEKATYSLEKGDVLFVRSSVKPSGVGLTTVVDEDLENAVYSGFLIRFREKGKLYHDYKAYCFHDPGFRNRLIAKSSVSANTNINQESLKLLRIALPPTLSEQQAIATALSDVDELIRSLDGLIQKREAIKKGTMQQLLTGKKRLPGFDGEWEVKALGEFAENISSGKSNTKTKVGKFPVYGSTGIIGWDTTYDYKGDRILVARVGANAGTVNQVNGKYNVSDNTLMITLKSNVNMDFIRYYLIHYDLGTLIFGSGQPLITGGQLKKLDIEIPNLDLQNKIVEILSDMDREIQVLRQKREKTWQIKQGMMQELLTGNVRLV